MIWSEEQEPSENVAGAACGGWLRKACEMVMLNLPLERISVEPHIQLS
jgi:hypothetical protein